MRASHTQLSKNFMLPEFLKSETARASGYLWDLQLNPPREVVDNLRGLAQNLLQPPRDYFGHSITVNSGYRHPKVNRAVKGSRTSEHVLGMAGDVELPDDYPEISAPRTDAFLREVKMEFGVEIDPSRVNGNFLLFAYIILHSPERPFGQLIHEYGSDGNPAWVHVSHRPAGYRKGNYNEILIKRSGEAHRRLTAKEAIRLGL